MHIFIYVLQYVYICIYIFMDAVASGVQELAVPSFALWSQWHLSVFFLRAKQLKEGATIPEQLPGDQPKNWQAAFPCQAWQWDVS